MVSCWPFFYFVLMETIYFEWFRSSDLAGLVDYLAHLSPTTRQRFGPHPFDEAAILRFYSDPFDVWGFLAKSAETGAIVAYAPVKRGYLEHDRPRLEAYGLSLSQHMDCTFAPSVADDWQGQGLGGQLFNFIQTELQARGIRRVILWGGVQTSNADALRFYGKMGFRVLGGFEYEGGNWDMVKEWGG